MRAANLGVYLRGFFVGLASDFSAMTIKRLIASDRLGSPVCVAVAPTQRRTRLTV